MPDDSKTYPLITPVLIGASVPSVESEWHFLESSIPLDNAEQNLTENEKLLLEQKIKQYLIAHYQTQVEPKLSNAKIMDTPFLEKIKIHSDYDPKNKTFLLEAIGEFKNTEGSNLFITTIIESKSTDNLNEFSFSENGASVTFDDLTLNSAFSASPLILSSGKNTSQSPSITTPSQPTKNQP